MNDIVVFYNEEPVLVSREVAGYRLMEKAYKEGKVRVIDLSNFSATQILLAGLAAPDISCYLHFVMQMVLGVT